MNLQELYHQIQQKQSFLCVGLDTDLARIPKHLLGYNDPVLAFNREIIAATSEYAIAYKPNIAFYESMGSKGWDTLENTLALIPDNILTIADAKRGDIGNTTRMYARTFFETFGFDAVTVAPYMGADSVMPFLEFENKWVFLLALTSNVGAQDFQHHANGEEKLFEKVIRKGLEWDRQSLGHLGFVVGATQSASLEHIRTLAPQSLMLVPGVGAQGGNLNEVCTFGKTDMGGLLINSSRGILYAGDGEDFAEKAALAAKSLQMQMRVHIA